MTRFLLLALAPVIAVSAPLQCVLAHPSDGYTAADLHPNFGQDNHRGLPEGLSIAGLDPIFPFPSPSDLTNAEKYMLAGTTSSEWGDDLGPWWKTVFKTVSAYYSHYGKIPAEFSLDMLKAVSADADNLTTEWSEIYRSPLTGKMPRLDARQHSPGDLYIHLLTEDEIAAYAELNGDFYSLYYDGMEYDPHADACVPAEITSGIFYVRVHGLNKSIYETITFNWRRTN